MGEVGCNVSHRGEPPVTEVKGLGAQWVRVVLVPDIYPSSLLKQYKRAGLKVLAVLARESFPGGGPYGPMTTTYVRAHGNDIDAYQCGNEPDHASPSSWTMSQDEYADLLRQCHNAITRIHFDATIVLAGGASGDPNYFKRGDILRYADGCALHPYGQDGDVVPAPSGNFGKASDLVGRYHDALGLPCWVTEYGSDSPDDQRAALYVGDLTRQFKADPRVRTATHFCLSDLMVEGFGLFNIHGIKPQGQAFWAAATAGGGSPVATVEERLAQLERQQSLQSQAIAQVLANHYADGPQSAKGSLVQLDPNKYSDLAVVEMTPKA